VTPPAAGREVPLAAVAKQTSFGGPHAGPLKIMVTGASGRIGRATIDQLVQARSGMTKPFKILAGVRDEYGPAALEMGKMKGVEVDECLPAVPQTILRTANAFKPTVAFIVTPPTENRLEMVKSTVDVLKEAGVQFILVLSMPAAEKPNSTVFGSQFCKIETAVKGCQVPYCVLRVPFLLENLLDADSLEAIRDGSLVSVAVPSAHWTGTCSLDVGVMAATILMDPEPHIGRTYTVASQPYSHETIASAISGATGRQVQYESVPYFKFKRDQIKKGREEWEAKGLLGMAPHR